MEDKDNTLLRVFQLGLIVNDTVMFQGVDLRINPGNVYLITGPDDTANDWLLRGMAGILRNHPLQGRVWFDGMDIYSSNEKELKEIKKRVAFVFSEGTMISNLTIEENLLLPLHYHVPDFDRSAVMEKIKKGFDFFEIPDVMDHRPAELSYSLMKKLAFVRAGLREPELILIDKPLFNLAERHGVKVMTFLEQLKAQGAALVITSHCPSKFETLADEEIRLEDGVLIL